MSKPLILSSLSWSMPLQEGFTVVPLSPGALKTDMNKHLPEELLQKYGFIAKETGVKVLLDNVILKVGKGHNAQFLGHDGAVLPW